MNKYLLVGANLVSGSFLIFAAIAKAQSLHFDIVSAAKILTEVCFGAFILCSLSVLSLRVALLIFSIFAIVNVRAILVGESTCGCMGEIRVPVHAMLLTDIFVVGLIAVVLRYSVAQLFTDKTGTVRSIAIGSVIAVIVLLTQSWSREQAAALRLDSAIIDVGIQHNEGKVEHSVRLTNRTESPVKIVSISPRCSVRALDLKWEIGPKTSKILPLEIPVRGTPGTFKRRAEIYFDCPTQTKLEIFIQGRFQPSN